FVHRHMPDMLCHLHIVLPDMAQYGFLALGVLGAHPSGGTALAKISKYVLKEGDIVFSRVGSVDRCSYVDAAHDGWMFSGRCLRVRPNTEVDPLYLYYFFCLEDTKQFVRNIAVGATMPSINTKLLGE